MRRRARRCVTPCRPRRSRWSAIGSPAFDRTSDDAAEHRAQEDLQAAIAADVVERAPHHGAVRLFLRRSALSGRRDCAPTIFGTPVVPEVSSTHSVGSEAAGIFPAAPIAGAQATRTGRSAKRLPASRDRSPPRRSRQRRSARRMRGIGIGRQNRDAAGDAVKLDQGERRRQLARSSQAGPNGRPVRRADRRALVPPAR